MQRQFHRPPKANIIQLRHQELRERGHIRLAVSDRGVHIGLGEATIADSIEIVCPSGAKQVLEKVAANQFLTIKEPAS